MKQGISRLLFLGMSFGIIAQPLQAAAPSVQERAIQRALKIVDSLPTVTIDPRLSAAAKKFKTEFQTFGACVRRGQNCSKIRRGLYITALSVIAYFAIIGSLATGIEIKKRSILNEIEAIRSQLPYTVNTQDLDEWLVRVLNTPAATFSERGTTLLQDLKKVRDGYRALQPQSVPM